MKFDILSKARVKDNVVYLPPDKLKRSVYVSVNEILENLGGKWDRKIGGHLFRYDPTEALKVVVRDKIVPPKNPTAFHPTPLDVIEYAMENGWLNQEGMRLLEPSAGTGNASKIMKERYPLAHLDVVEYLPINASILREFHENVFEMDFMEFDSEPYDFIFMNPPFSVKGNKTIYIDHIYHAHELLKENRSMYVIVPSGVLSNSTKKVKAFRKWCFDRLLWLEKIEGGKFSTTKVSTVMMKLRWDAWTLNEYNGWNSRNAWVASLVIDNVESLYRTKKKEGDYFWYDVEREGAKMDEYFVLTDRDKEDLIRHYQELEG